MSDRTSRILAGAALAVALYSGYKAHNPAPQAQFSPDVAAFLNKAYEATTVTAKVRQALNDAEKKAKDAEAESAKLREELAKAKEVK
jgi:hypothetical protein